MYFDFSTQEDATPLGRNGLFDQLPCGLLGIPTVGVHTAHQNNNFVSLTVHMKHVIIKYAIRTIHVCDLHTPCHNASFIHGV